VTSIIILVLVLVISALVYQVRATNRNLSALIASLEDARDATAEANDVLSQEPTISQPAQPCDDIRPDGTVCQQPSVNIYRVFGKDHPRCSEHSL